MTKGLTRPITRRQALSYRRLRPNGLGVTAIAAVNGRRKKKSKAPKRKKTVCFQAKKNYRYTTRGARDELKHLKAKRQFSPRELASLRRDGKVTRGGKKFYSPYLVGYHQQELRAKKRAAKPAPRRYASARPNTHRPEYDNRYRRTRSSYGPPRRNTGRIAGMPVVSLGDDHPYVMQRYPLVHVPKKTRRRDISGAFQRARARARKSEEKVMRKRRSTKRSLAAKKAARTRARKHAARVAAGKKAARTRRRRVTSKAAPRKRRRAAARRPTHRRRATRRRRYRRNGEGATAAAPAVAKPNRRKRRAKARRKVATGRRRTYRRVVAKVGTRRVPTYMYRTKRGTKHLPLYMEAGARSLREFKAATTPHHKKANTKVSQRIRKRVAAIMRARTKGPSRRVASMFTPNRGIVIPFAAWSKSMKPNRRRKKAAKRSTKRARRASPRRRRRTVRTAARRTRRRRKVAAAPRRRRRRKVAAAAPRKRRRRRSYAKNTHRRRRRAHAAPRRRRRYARNRRRRYLPLHVGRVTYRSNKRRHHRRHYRRNRGHAASHGFRANDFLGNFVGLLKVGLVGAAGLIGHRLVSGIIGNAIPQTGPMAAYRSQIGQFAAAALAMVALPFVGSKFKQPEIARQLTGGVFASLAWDIYQMIANKFAPQYAHMLAGYADNSGRAYSGWGEYVATSGFGASPMLSQAAAGFGNPMLSQAAAGYGEYVATSGFGAAPMLSQAAAGTGEYVASGVQGIGDYEMVNGVGSFGVDDDGIKPNLTSAEHALNIAEAAAGVAIGDLPPQSTQWPMMVAKPIGDTMTGARAGTFQGRDGIFG